MVEPVLRTMALILGAQVAALAALERATPRTGRGIRSRRDDAPAGHRTCSALRRGLDARSPSSSASALRAGHGVDDSGPAPRCRWRSALLIPGADARGRPALARYALKANVWLAIFGWVGNYWYTHYFYSVLGAAYTMPAHHNGVPWCMFFATHFYFCFYHVLSNCALRFIARHAPGRARPSGPRRCSMAYFTASPRR